MPDDREGFVDDDPRLMSLDLSSDDGDEFVRSEHREKVLQERIVALQAQVTEERDLRRQARRQVAANRVESPTSFRLLVVANRLPMSLTKDEFGQWSATMSSGGLVSALMGVKNMEMKWIGWPGATIDNDADRQAIVTLLAEKNCKPVFLSKNLTDLYYSGYANNVIWPLFHYMPPPIDHLKNSNLMFEAYETVNQMFADEVLSEYRHGDIVWVHDYHLMLLPGILRTASPKMQIGFFLHTPFPSSEIYRILPQRDEIVHSLLSSDLIGFQVYDYCR